MKKRAKMRSGHPVRQMLLILLLIAILVMMLISEAWHAQSGIGRETATLSSYTYTDELAGYVFRQEAVVTDGDYNGALQYLVADGAAVTAQDAVARAYAAANGTERAEAAPLYAEIARLERALAEADWQNGYMTSYAAMMQAISGGDWHAGTDAAALLGTSLAQASADVSEAAVHARIAELQGQIDEINKWVGEPREVKVSESGYFCYETDGYETLFGLGQIKNVTPEKLDLWLQNIGTAQGAIGKVVSAGPFYLAVPLSAREVAAYTVGTTYPVRFVRGGETDMLLESTVLSGDGARALLILRADRSPEGMDPARRQSVIVERETVSGIRVPATALQTDDRGSFVYIAKDGIARQRRVEVLCFCDGCCIVAEQDGEDRLRRGEQILITTRRIYEGKVLNK